MFINLGTGKIYVVLCNLLLLINSQIGTCVYVLDIFSS